jgi:predicted outer membrane lipoprotein
MEFSQRWLLRGLLLAAAAMVGTASAHEHHEDEIPEGQGISAEPIVSCSPYYLRVA